jgi:hypothetical protein
VNQGDSQSLHKIEFEPPPTIAEEQPLQPSEDGFDVGSGESLLLALRGTASDETKEVSSEPRFSDVSAAKFLSSCCNNKLYENDVDQLCQMVTFSFWLRPPVLSESNITGLLDCQRSPTVDGHLSIDLNGP